MPMFLACPECGSPMRLRHHSRGAFLGCSKYPECKVTRAATPELLEKAQADDAAEDADEAPRERPKRRRPKLLTEQWQMRRRQRRLLRGLAIGLFYLIGAPIVLWVMILMAAGGRMGGASPRALVWV